MRSLGVLAASLFLSACATTGGLDDRSLGWACTAEATGEAVRALSHRSLDFQGGLRRGRTEFDLTLAGTAPARLLADWDARDGVPELGEGRYRFRMSRHVVPAEPGQIQLVGGAVALRSGTWSPGLSELRVSGRELAELLAGGSPLVLRTVGRDGRVLGSAPLERAAFERALQLARQADAASLAKAADYRRLCQREERIIPT